MNVNKNQRVLLLKYSQVHVKDPIEQHIEILNKNNFVWYGKFGLSPSNKTLNLIQHNDHYYIILYSVKAGSFICKVEEVTKDKPKKDYPEYYLNFSSKDLEDFNVFFKIVEIKKPKDSFLKNYVLASTYEPAGMTINRSMAPMFILRKINDNNDY